LDRKKNYLGLKYLSSPSSLFGGSFIVGLVLLGTA
jgi:hypothetical protein